jgi:hypothetical protein
MTEQIAYMCGSTFPIVHVIYFGPHGWNTSGFTLLLADAPRWRAREETTEGKVPMDWLLEQHPEVGRALDLAREHGAASLVDGVWRADPEAAAEHRRIADAYAVEREHDVGE